MKCPSCGAGNARVMETRRDDLGGLFRRRVCDQCCQQVVTHEQVTDHASIPNWVYDAGKLRLHNPKHAQS